MESFYDQLAPFYHLVYPDWEASIQLQGQQLAEIIRSNWPRAQIILDVSCGIGTQSLGLAMQRFDMVASDPSTASVERARREASLRGLQIDFSVCDVRGALDHHGQGFDIVLSADNSLAHLENDGEILIALKQMLGCCKPGGGCVITLRDYDAEPKGTDILKPYGVRVEGRTRSVLFQIWDFEGQHYQTTMVIVQADLQTGKINTQLFRSRCYAISTDRLCKLMEDAGFVKVRRLNGVFYQPVLVGTGRL